MPRQREQGRERYPSGKLKPDTTMSPTMIRRIVDQARSGAANPLLGSELGQLRLHGALTDREVAAGLQYAQTAGRYQRLKGLPPPTPKSPAYQQGFGRGAGVDADEAMIAQAEKRYAAVCAVLRGFGRGVVSAVDMVCLFDRPIAPTSQPALKYALSAVAVHFGLTAKAR